MLHYSIFFYGLFLFYIDIYVLVDMYVNEDMADFGRKDYYFRTQLFLLQHQNICTYVMCFIRMIKIDILGWLIFSCTIHGLVISVQAILLSILHNQIGIFMWMRLLGIIFCKSINCFTYCDQLKLNKWKNNISCSFFDTTPIIIWCKNIEDNLTPKNINIVNIIN